MPLPIQSRHIAASVSLCHLSLSRENLPGGFPWRSRSGPSGQRPAENLTGDNPAGQGQGQPREKAERESQRGQDKRRKTRRSLLTIIKSRARRPHLTRPCPCPSPPPQGPAPHSTAPRNGGQAAAPAAATPAPPRRGRRVVATARRRRRGHGHWHARPPAQAREAAQQHAARGRAARPAWWRSRHWHGVVQPVPGQLGVRRHAADVRRGGVPLRGAGVRLPEVWPARQAVPQVPVAPGVLRAPEVRTRARLHRSNRIESRRASRSQAPRPRRAAVQCRLCSWS